MVVTVRRVQGVCYTCLEVVFLTGNHLRFRLVCVCVCVFVRKKCQRAHTHNTRARVYSSGNDDSNDADRSNVVDVVDVVAADDCHDAHDGFDRRFHWLFPYPVQQAMVSIEHN